MKTAQELLAKAKRRLKSVDLPIGETVLVRSLGAAEMSNLVATLEGLGEDNYPEAAALQVAAFMADERGEAMFTIEQAREFISQDSTLVRPILEAGNRLNGLTKDSIEDAQGN